MQIVTTRSALKDVPAVWSRRRLELDAPAFVRQDEDGQVSVYALFRPRFLSPLRKERLEFVGRLPRGLAVKVIPLLREGAKLRVRLVDVPAPSQGEALATVAVSIWAATAIHSFNRPQGGRNPSRRHFAETA